MAVYKQYVYNCFSFFVFTGSYRYPTRIKWHLCEVDVVEEEIKNIPVSTIMAVAPDTVHRRSTT